MRTFPQIGLVLAAAIALAGCQATAVGQVSLNQPGAKPGATTPATTPATNPGANAQIGQKPGATNPVAPKPVVAAKPPVAVGKVPAATAQASVSAGQETAAALAEEREMDDYDLLAGQDGAGGYELFQLGDVLAAAEKARQAGLAAGNAGREAGKIGMEAGANGAVAGSLGAKAGADAARAGADAAAAGGAAVRAGLIIRGALKPKEKAEIDRLIQKSKELRGKAVKLEVKAEVLAKVAERQGKRAEKLGKRLEKMKDAREAIRGKLKDAAWVDNGDGTSSRTLEIAVSKTLNGKTFERKAKLVRTIRNEDKVLILSTGEFTQALPGGLTRTSTRSKTLNADGTYSIEFKSVITMPNGTTRTASWTKTVDVEGGVTGTGTIVWTAADGSVKKTVTVTLGGDEDEPKADCEDKATGGEAEVTVNEDGTVEASIGDADSGNTAEVDLDTSSDGTVEVIADESSVSVEADGTVNVEEGPEAVVGADGGVSLSNGGASLDVGADGAATAAAEE